MRVKLGELRRIVREAIAGSRSDEAYDKELVDDPAMAQRSVYVPDDIKDSIGHWLKAMGLSHSKKKRLRSP